MAANNWLCAGHPVYVDWEWKPQILNLPNPAAQSAAEAINSAIAAGCHS